MKLSLSLSALACLVLTFAPDAAEATWGYAAAAAAHRRPSCKEKNGSCRTLLGREGFNFKIGHSALCLPQTPQCGEHGVTCDNKPKVDYCPENYTWTFSPFLKALLHAFLGLRPDLLTLSFTPFCPQGSNTASVLSTGPGFRTWRQASSLCLTILSICFYRKLCVPTSGDNEDDDDDPDCLEGAVWKDGVRLRPLDPFARATLTLTPSSPLTPARTTDRQRCQVENDHNCNSSTHFWWSGGARCGQATTNRCVPRTTPSKAVTPPVEVGTSACCPTGWTWYNFGGKKICAPPSPKFPSCKGKPQCPSTHGWDGSKGSSARRLSNDVCLAPPPPFGKPH